MNRYFLFLQNVHLVDILTLSHTKKTLCRLLKTMLWNLLTLEKEKSTKKVCKL